MSMHKHPNAGVRRKTMIFHSEWKDMIEKGITDKDLLLDTYRYILEYGFTGEYPIHDVDPTTDAYLSKFSGDIQKDYDRFVQYMRKMNAERYAQTGSVYGGAQ